MQKFCCDTFVLLGMRLKPFVPKGKKRAGEGALFPKNLQSGECGFAVPGKLIWELHQ